MLYMLCACVCFRFQSEVLGVLEEEIWRSFQQRNLKFNQVWANILWMSPLNTFSSSQDELPLKLSGNPVGFNTFLSNLTVEILGFFLMHWVVCFRATAPKSRVSLQLPLMEHGQAQLAEVLCAAHLRLGAPEVRKVRAGRLLSLDTNHLGQKKKKQLVERLEAENDSFQVRYLSFSRWTMFNFRGVDIFRISSNWTFVSIIIFHIRSHCEPFGVVWVVHVGKMTGATLAAPKRGTFWSKWLQTTRGIFLEVGNPHKMGQPIILYI